MPISEQHVAFMRELAQAAQDGWHEAGHDQSDVTSVLDLILDSSDELIEVHNVNLGGMALGAALVMLLREYDTMIDMITRRDALIEATRPVLDAIRRMEWYADWNKNRDTLYCRVCGVELWPDTYPHRDECIVGRWLALPDQQGAG